MEKICFFGNALLDFSASCSNAMLKNYGLRVDENCEYTARQSGLIEELQKLEDLVVTPGGSAQNSARVTQWLLRPILGDSRVGFVGCVGKDHFGQLLAEKVTSVGVKTFYDVNDTELTGITAGLVTQDNKRTLCARIGAATKFNACYLKTPLLENIMRNCDVIYVEGFFVPHNSNLVMELAKFATENGKMFGFNLSARYVCQDHLNALKRIIPHVDILFGNDQEMTALAKQVDGSVKDLKEIATLLAGCNHFPTLKSSRTVIITCGPDPVIVCEKNSPILEFPVKKVDHIRDTIGAGDSFVGGYFASLIVGEKDIGEHVKFAIEIARNSLENRGCSFPPNPNKNLINLLKNFLKP